MVKSLKYEHGNKSRRKSSRIKQRGGSTTGSTQVLNEGANEEIAQTKISEEQQYVNFLEVIFDKNSVIEILKKFPTQSFKEINDDIVKLFENSPNFTIEQLCGLLYVLMYKIDNLTYPIKNFPNIVNKKLTDNRINFFKLNINSIKDNNILNVLNSIIKTFKGEDSKKPERNVEAEQTFENLNEVVPREDSGTPQPNNIATAEQTFKNLNLSERKFNESNVKKLISSYGEKGSDSNSSDDEDGNSSDDADENSSDDEAENSSDDESEKNNQHKSTATNIMSNFMTLPR